MPDFDQWLYGALPFGWDDADIAVNVGNIVQDKPTSIVITRSGSQLDAQTVRIEPVNMPTRRLADATVYAGIDVLVIGYKNHPAVDDTDIQEGDQFLVDYKMFDVYMVQPGYTDRVLALCKAIQ